MSVDKEKLKALAKAADAVTTNVHITMAVGADPAEIKVVQDYLQQAMPKTILALIAEIERLAEENENLRDCRSSVNASVALENESLRAVLDGMVLVPVAPTPGLLMSMAIRHDHGLGVPGYYDQPLMQRANHGVSHARMVECALSDMRKIYEEVVGSGFFSSAKEADYAAMAKGRAQ
jgi:hypothetical protein